VKELIVLDYYLDSEVPIGGLYWNGVNTGITGTPKNEMINIRIACIF
jgi:hypothetical protein